MDLGSPDSAALRCVTQLLDRTEIYCLVCAHRPQVRNQTSRLLGLSARDRPASKDPPASDERNPQCHEPVSGQQPQLHRDAEALPCVALWTRLTSPIRGRKRDGELELADSSIGRGEAVSCCLHYYGESLTWQTSKHSGSYLITLVTASVTFPGGAPTLASSECLMSRSRSQWRSKRSY